MSTPDSPLALRRRAAVSSLTLSPEASSPTPAKKADSFLAKRATEMMRDVRFTEAAKEILPRDSSGRKSAELVNIAYRIYRKYAAEELTFSSKPSGVNIGFIADISNDRLHVKSFLGSSSGRPKSVELFVYKLLENLGFGAQVEALDCEGNLAFLVSHDLVSTNPCELKIGAGLADYLSTRTDNIKYKTRAVAVELLAKILALSDVRNNTDNVGIIVVDVGTEEEMYPVIVDFTLDPTIFDHQLTEGGSALRFPSMSARFSADANTPQATVGLTRSFARTGLERSIYMDAIEMIAPDKFEAAVEESRVYCEEFARRITDEELGSEFSSESLAEYIGIIRRNFGNLCDKKEALDEVREGDDAVVGSVTRAFFSENSLRSKSC